MVGFFPAHQVVPVHVNLQIEIGVKDAKTEEKELGPKEEPAVSDDRIRQQAERAAKKCFRQGFHARPIAVMERFQVTRKNSTFYDGGSVSV
jgi:hypothetical protein